MPLFDFLKKDKTTEYKFRKPLKKFKKGSKQKSLNASLKISLKTGSLIKDAVKLPAGESLYEWIAMNTVELYNTMNICYGIICEFCTATTCTQMTAGPVATYYWADRKKSIKKMSLPAPEYVDKVENWILEQLDDPTIFPTEGSEFGKDFLPTVKKILSRMFRVYAHIYWDHWERVKTLNAEAHINSCFKHFYYFSIEFELIDKKDLMPMQSLLEKL